MMIPITGTILITGASGFLGRAVVETLAKARWPLRLALRQAPANPRFETALIGDLAGPVAWDEHLAGIAAIVHIAGLAHQPPGTPERLMFQVNTDASDALARAAARHGISRFIHISSVRAVVGPSSPLAVGEDAAALPTDAYGRSKHAAEQAITAHLPAPAAISAASPAPPARPCRCPSAAFTAAVRSPPTGRLPPRSVFCWQGTRSVGHAPRSSRMTGH
jgi:nucleoside-diphosphate-sugar epimerase